MAAPGRVRAQTELNSLGAAIGHAARALKSVQLARQRSEGASRSATRGTKSYELANEHLSTAERSIKAAMAKLNVKVEARRKAHGLGFER